MGMKIWKSMESGEGIFPQNNIALTLIQIHSETRQFLTANLQTLALVMAASGW